MNKKYRYFIELAYKGTEFHGWQRQPNAISVQEVIENALEKLLRTKTNIVGAGRTDTGVHAYQMFAHFDVASPIDESDFSYRLNALVPKTVVIKKIIKVSSQMHARFDAKYRCYEYHIHLESNPFSVDTSWQIYQKIYDVDNMNTAANLLLKHTNFKAFSKSKTDVKTYHCAISRAEWMQKNNQLVFYITANRFLRNMVRAIVGTLLEVGTGKMSIDEFEKVILSQHRSEAGLSVPARGLFLSEIGY